MPRSKLILTNVSKEDKTFASKLPRQGLRRWDRIKKDHPTPFVFVEYETEEDCRMAIEEINADPDNYFSAKPCTEKLNRSSDSLDKAGTRKTSKNNSFNMPPCVLCEKPAMLMCERCLDPYCSFNCQKSDWKNHRSVCRRMPKLIPLDDAVVNNNNKLPSENAIPERNHREAETSKSPGRPWIPTAAAMKSPVKMTNGEGLSEPQRTPEKVEMSEKPQSIKTVQKMLNDVPRLDFPPSGSKVAVLHTINTPNAYLFVRPHAAKAAFDRIMKMAKANAQQLPSLQKPPETGRLYLAPFLEDEDDDHWYRVIVKTFSPDTQMCFVAYIDFGNTSNVPMKTLRQMPEELVQIPRVTFRVMLKGVKNFGDNESDKRYLEEILTKSLMMTYDGEPQTLDTQVMLTDENDKSVNDFFNREQLSEMERLRPKYKFSMDSVPMKTLTVIENVDIVVQFDGLLKEGCISIVLLSDLKKLNEIQTLAAKIAEKSEVYRPQENELCLAKYAYGDDEAMWYRVVVDDKVEKNSTFLVNFIDFGNYDCVEAKNIREIDQELLMECPLIHVKIEGIDTPWPKNRIAKFKQFTSDVIKAKKIEYKDQDYVISLPHIVDQL